jgi:sugar O-acyltransferase (sialic acid O-acetyltransferase NeuD family)
MKDLVIVGTSTFGEVVLEYFREYSEYRVVAFACHAAHKRAESHCDLPVVTLEDLERTHPPGAVTVFVAIGYRRMNQFRRDTYLELKARGYSFATFVAPDVKLWKSNRIGENVFIFERNVIQPYVEIGDDTVLWSGNHVGHHSRLGSHVFVASHVVISGACRIGDRSFIGVNATFHDGITIGERCLVGAGAVVSKDARDGEVYVPYATKPFPKSSDQLEF